MAQSIALTNGGLDLEHVVYVQGCSLTTGKWDKWQPPNGAEILLVGDTNLGKLREKLAESAFTGYELKHSFGQSTPRARVKEGLLTILERDADCVVIPFVDFAAEDWSANLSFKDPRVGPKDIESAATEYVSGVKDFQSERPQGKALKILIVTNSDFGANELRKSAPLILLGRASYAPLAADAFTGASLSTAR